MSISGLYNMLYPFSGSINNRTNELSNVAMVLHIGTREIILFDFWKTGTTLGLSVSMLIVFLLSILYEALKALRIFFVKTRELELRNEQSQPTIVVGESSEHVDGVSTEYMTFPSGAHLPGLESVKRLFSWYRIVLMLLYCVQVLLAYVLMLIAMTFNVWLIITIAFGEAVGYFLFSTEPVLDTC